ncbi:ABC transporter substrate-binding protein [Bosea sp. LjRoot90]|uniref:ABC transporter substrate-binding protein n=1 Tax=Bosea sp. LjRoot90 TaxID=3342342 RepID=UPI003ECFECB8
MRLATAFAGALMGLGGFLGIGATVALAQGQPVPEIKVLTWPAAKYQHYFETSNYVAEGWRKLGLKVTLDPQPFPSPMLSKWFKEHDFDVVMSVLSGSPQRSEPDFFTNAQFNSRNSAPGDSNVGSFSSPKVDELGARQLALYDAQERRKVIYELQRVLADEQPEAVLAYVVNTFAMNTAKVEIPGYEDTSDGPRSLWNMLRLTSKAGTAVKIGRTIDQGTFNPLAATIVEDFNTLSLVYDKLVELGADGSPRMWLAEALEVVDPTTVVVKLRQGHSFSDGKPVTAEDVKFSFDYLKRWDAAYFKKYLEKLASVEIVDPTTVRFKLTEAYAPFIINTLGQVLILPKHVWEGVVEKTGIAKPQDFRNMPLIGSGPYVLRYWREGQEISLQRRPDHFAKPASDLLIVVFGSAELVGASLKKGDIDVSFQPIVPTVVKEFAAEKNIKLIQARSNGHMSMRYNTARPALASKALRQAMAHAIPYEAIIEEILGGDAGRSATPIVPVNAFWHDGSIPLPAYDIDKAKAILKAAGFSWGPDGVLRAPAK